MLHVSKNADQKSHETKGVRTVLITGTGHYLPGEPVETEMLADQWPDIPVLTAMRYFGVEKRHLVIDPRTGERGTIHVKGLEVPLGTTEMAAQASMEAMASAGITVDEVDLVITNSTTPDAALPPITLLLQRRLGFGAVQMIDLRGGCAAGIQGFAIATMMVRSGQAKTVLLAGSECTSPFYFRKLQMVKRAASMDDVLNGLLFADGAGAIVLQDASAAHAEAECALRVGYSGSRSCFPEEKVGFELHQEVGGSVETRHDHRAIRRTLPKVVARAYEELAHFGSSYAGGYDLVIIPQVNRSMIEIVTDKVDGTDERRFYIGHETGNVPAAGMMMALDIARQRKRLPRRGSIAVLSVETTSWMFAVAELSVGENNTQEKNQIRGRHSDGCFELCDH
jgi:3-oxoacyl-[acyl-carrier-protein] synthase III